MVNIWAGDFEVVGLSLSNISRSTAGVPNGIRGGLQWYFMGYPVPGDCASGLTQEVALFSSQR